MSTHDQPGVKTGTDEAVLVDRCRRGDAAAWEQVFELHYPVMGRFVFQLSPEFSREDVEEVCQDAFLAAIRHLGTFRGGSTLQTWLLRIAANKARDRRERQSATKRGGGRPTVSLDAEDPETGLAMTLPGPTPSPDAAVVRQERLQLVRHALDQVGAPCREVLELRYFADLSYEELSRTLHLNVKTVSSRLSKCLDRLGQSIRELEAREDAVRAEILPGKPVQ